MRSTIRDFLWAVVVALGCGSSTVKEHHKQEFGYWTFGSDREWSQAEGGALDQALSEFIVLKKAYGDNFNVVVQDQHSSGTPTSDGEETAKIHIKVYVSPRNEEIERKLKELGLMYVES